MSEDLCNLCSHSQATGGDSPRTIPPSSPPGSPRETPGASSSAAPGAGPSAASGARVSAASGAGKKAEAGTMTQKPFRGTRAGRGGRFGKMEERRQFYFQAAVRSLAVIFK